MDHQHHHTTTFTSCQSTTVTDSSQPTTTDPPPCPPHRALWIHIRLFPHHLPHPSSITTSNPPTRKSQISAPSLSPGTRERLEGVYITSTRRGVRDVEGLEPAAWFRGLVRIPSVPVAVNVHDDNGSGAMSRESDEIFRQGPDEEYRDTPTDAPPAEEATPDAHLGTLWTCPYNDTIATVAEEMESSHKDNHDDGEEEEEAKLRAVGKGSSLVRRVVGKVRRLSGVRKLSKLVRRR
ncbi:MAG: hypothetical protein M1827_006004 [Pycnora praestabilis]|nr:MAG: hypothetical protein M1827_006004 [Pycnora praestabilis]